MGTEVHSLSLSLAVETLNPKLLPPRTEWAWLEGFCAFNEIIGSKRCVVIKFSIPMSQYALATAERAAQKTRERIMTLLVIKESVVENERQS
jgi:hypothetical protein